MSISRRQFVSRSAIGVVGAAVPVLETLPADAESFVERDDIKATLEVLSPPDAWEMKLREIEKLARVLRESRRMLVELESNPGLSEKGRYNVQYCYCLTIDHCARVMELLAQESRWKSDAILWEHYAKAYPKQAAARRRI